MPTMSVIIAPRGTPLAEGGTSSVGHMYYTITDSSGITYSYGFAPAVHGTAFGDGRVYTNDNINYQGYQYNKDISLSESQFQQLLAWSELRKLNGDYGDYWGIGNNCITFTYDALASAGIAPANGKLFSDIWPSWNGDEIDQIFSDYYRGPDLRSIWEIEGLPIDPTTNTDFYNATRSRPVPRDPLAIDLDGDGIETVGIVQGATPVLFDHDADGVRTGTGWLQGDDAWLVLDRNGNGRVDSGRELFGVDTLISGTAGTISAVYARNGFEVLRTLDANGDNLFNASDAAFAQVRLWRDLNQDGISQSNELSTLSSQGITGIGLVPSTTVTNLGNGNTISGTATVTRSDGSNTTAAGVGVSTTAANLDLANNPFYREFTTPVALTTQAQALPEMQGSGWVRDLREAMSLGTPQGNALAAKVQQFAAATTHSAQMALLDEVIRAWADTNQTQASLNDPNRRFALNGNAATTAR